MIVCQILKDLPPGYSLKRKTQDQAIILRLDPVSILQFQAPASLFRTLGLWINVYKHYSIA